MEESYEALYSVLLSVGANLKAEMVRVWILKVVMAGSASS